MEGVESGGLVLTKRDLISRARQAMNVLVSYFTVACIAI